MSQTAPPTTPPGKPSQPTPPPAVHLRWIWVLLVLTAIMATSLLRGRRAERTEITYTELLGQLERRNIASVEIIADERELTGELRTPLRIGERDVREFHTTLPLVDPAPLVLRLEERGVTIHARTPGPSWISLLLSVLPWLGLGLFWLLLLRPSRLGTAAQAFGRTGAHIAAERPAVTFSDVAGADEAKTELREVIDFLKNPSRFQRVGGRLPKGVLLVGPPGTGKTLLAQAVAGEAAVPFYSISGSDFVELFVGVGAARVRSLFAEGKAHAPCIIFIDELDAVGRQRGAGLTAVHEEREQTLNQLLVELDGFQPTQGVVVLSATNRPDVLDPALLRPGRFDRQIVVELPDIRAREQILDVHVRKIRLAADVDLAGIARATPGLSGADLANLVNEAALFAARRDKEQADQRDFEDAKDKVMLGVERRSLVLTAEDRRLAAYHEAGHALVNLLLPGLDPVQKVSIVPRGRALGITYALPQQERRTQTRAYLLGRLATAYGGRAAEELVFGPERITTGAANDFQQATELARRMVTEFGMSDAVGPIAVSEHPEAPPWGWGALPRHEVSPHTAELVDREIRRLVDEAHHQAGAVLASHRPALDALADALLARETLEGAEIQAIVAGAAAAPRPTRAPELAGAA